MRKVLSMISKVAPARHPLLITGERGTGKEVVARTVHANGQHALSPFLPIDCDSLDPVRLEAELFGDEASPDPHKQAGLLHSAGEGTLCLHEIGTLALHLQARLLRLLETRQLTRKDSTAAPIPFQARIIATSSQDLEKLVACGQFRRDLFYKLNITQLRVPPLRERPEDLLPLAEQFLETHRADRGIPFVLSEAGLLSIERFDWPGNVAELEALIAHACLLSVEPILHFEDMPSAVRSFAVAVQPPPPLPDGAGDAFPTLEEREKDAIMMALEHARGDKILAARMLGIGKTTLYRKLKEYGIGEDAH
jgi:DNA-binding NtrC family response regulator